MNRSHFRVRVLTGSIVSAVLSVKPIAAQVIPDATLPAGERSHVTGSSTVQIDGGARRGSNLFHSFSQFSIPTGSSAYFNNAADVQNIFSRVTGGSVSSIDGVIRANGAANLFLLNPNGILFGPNARLNLGGSFVATTADSIHFADNFQYSATNPQTAPLLTVSVPVGLQMGTNPGPIAVQGNGYDLSVAVPIFSPIIRSSSTAGLRVPAGQTLALIGGDIAIDGGTLTAEQGQIELGSMRDGQVNLSSTPSGFAFAYQGSQRFGDIRLSRQALADASGGGVIQVQRNQVSLADGSLLLIQNQGTQSGGSIRVSTARSLELSGSSPGGGTYGGLTAQTAGVGRGADVTVSTQRFIAQSGAGVVTRSFSSGEAGNITVNASDSIQLIGFSPINPVLNSIIGSGSLNSGNGGAVTVLTRRLNLLDGGLIVTATFGTGNAGSLTVKATEAIKLIGVTPLIIGSGITSNANNAGDAGVITINTARLILRGGGTVNTSTVATGNAGSVTINAREFVDISGKIPGSPTLSYVGSAGSIVSEATRQALGVPARPSGNSGSVTINTPRLSISNGANASASNSGTGNAGTLRVNANSIFLDRGGSLTAATASGEGGNIDLNVRDFILLRNGSPITASADGVGNGGNIRIKAGSIVAVPNENSDIRANSVNARGGNITINTSGIFGIQFRPQDTPLSDITATGANSAQQGTVQVNLDRLDPTAGLVQLPAGVVDSSRLIAQGCPADKGNSFVITGRGGLPPTPEQLLDDDAEWDDREILTVAQPADTKRYGNTEVKRHKDTKVQGRRETATRALRVSPSPFMEANGWQTTPTGDIILVAKVADSTLQQSLNSLQNWLNHSTTCQGTQRKV